MQSLSRPRAPLATRATLAVLASVGLLVSGCGGASPTSAGSGAAASSASASPGGAGANPGTGSGMNMDMGSADSPSKPAAMICSPEIRDAVRRTFAMSRPPGRTPAWAKTSRTYTCTYQVPGGRLRLSVQDALQAKQGRASFDRLARSVAGATPLRGMDSFGFPSFSAPSGKVGFLKDGKTLVVDASLLPTSALPTGYSRQEAAFSVASAVIACWNEGS